MPKYTEKIEDEDRERSFRVLATMEKEYEKRNPRFFDRILEEESSLVLRVHAVTVLGEIGDEKSVGILADALRNDPSSLVRHECAFSLGQMGLKSAVPYLIEATLNDPSEIVRHESAAALGAIGDERARSALLKASQEESDEVKGSAMASLFYLDFLKYSKATQRETVDAEELISEIENKRKLTLQTEKKMPHP